MVLGNGRQEDLAVDRQGANGRFLVRPDSTVNISGGGVASDFFAIPGSMVNLFVTELSLDGSALDLTFGVPIEIATDPRSLLEATLADGSLIAAMVSDCLGDGFSAVYSFFEPDHSNRSLGTYMVLALIGRAAALGLPHVYLGYWIENSQKMSYKSRFQPLEALTSDGWCDLPAS